MSELREIDIRNYWPPVVRDTDEFQQIAKAENPEFNTLKEGIHRVLQDSFVRDATNYGVRRWESILNISPEPGDTLETRKERILAYLNVKLPYTWRVLNQMLIVLLGEGNVDIKLNNETATLTVSVALSTTAAQIAEVQTLLGRVLPQNIVTEIEWAGGMPITYTPVEYLESTGAEYLNTAVKATGDMQITLDFLVVNWGYTCYAFGSNELPKGNIMFTPDYNNAYNRAGRYTYGTQFLYFPQGTHQLDSRYLYVFDRNVVYRNGELASFYDSQKTMTEEEFVSKRPIMLFAAQHGNGIMHPMGSKRIWKFVIESAGTRVLDFIPALDETGAPCMFDLVSRKPFYNLGTGDFLYPGSESAVATVDLDVKFYAKLTSNGVRRLYHVPKGCTMNTDEYAAANGFKELVEPPAPLEGYWEPQWRETETQIICDWIETEPPTEEVTENE